jgi:hypothetical protein
MPLADKFSILMNFSLSLPCLSRTSLRLFRGCAFFVEAGAARKPRLGRGVASLHNSRVGLYYCFSCVDHTVASIVLHRSLLHCTEDRTIFLTLTTTPQHFDRIVCLHPGLKWRKQSTPKHQEVKKLNTFFSG